MTSEGIDTDPEAPGPREINWRSAVSILPPSAGAGLPSGATTTGRDSWTAPPFGASPLDQVFHHRERHGPKQFVSSDLGRRLEELGFPAEDTAYLEGQLLYLDRAYQEAAELYGEAAELVPLDRAFKDGSQRLQRAEELRAQGDRIAAEAKHGVEWKLDHYFKGITTEVVGSGEMVVEDVPLFVLCAPDVDGTVVSLTHSSARSGEAGIQVEVYGTGFGLKGGAQIKESVEFSVHAGAAKEIYQRVAMWAEEFRHYRDGHPYGVGGVALNGAGLEDRFFPDERPVAELPGCGEWWRDVTRRAGLGTPPKLAVEFGESRAKEFHIGLDIGGATLAFAGETRLMSTLTFAIQGLAPGRNWGLYWAEGDVEGLLWGPPHGPAA